MFGATTLIIAISALASLLPSVSSCAPHQRQEARLVDHAARLCDAFVPDRLLRQRLAERDALLQAVDHHLERTLGRPIERMQWWIAQARAACAISKPRPSPSRMLSTGTRTLSSAFHVAVRRVVVANTVSGRTTGHARRIAAAPAPSTAGHGAAHRRRSCPSR